MAQPLLIKMQINKECFLTRRGRTTSKQGEKYGKEKINFGIYDDNTTNPKRKWS